MGKVTFDCLIAEHLNPPSEPVVEDIPVVGSGTWLDTLLQYEYEHVWLKQLLGGCVPEHKTNILRKIKERSGLF